MFVVVAVTPTSMNALSSPKSCGSGRQAGTAGQKCCKWAGLARLNRVAVLPLCTLPSVRPRSAGNAGVTTHDPTLGLPLALHRCPLGPAEPRLAGRSPAVPSTTSAAHLSRRGVALTVLYA